MSESDFLKQTLISLNKFGFGQYLVDLDSLKTKYGTECTSLEDLKKICDIIHGQVEGNLVLDTKQASPYFSARSSVRYFEKLFVEILILMESSNLSLNHRESKTIFSKLARHNKSFKLGEYDSINLKMNVVIGLNLLILNEVVSYLCSIVRSDLSEKIKIYIESANELNTSSGNRAPTYALAVILYFMEESGPAKSIFKAFFKLEQDTEIKEKIHTRAYSIISNAKTKINDLKVDILIRNSRHQTALLWIGPNLIEQAKKGIIAQYHYPISTKGKEILEISQLYCNSKLNFKKTQTSHFSDLHYRVFGMREIITFIK